MAIVSHTKMSPALARRFWLRGLLGVAATVLLPLPAGFAQGSGTIHKGGGESGGSKGGGGKGGGESGGHTGGGESGGGHSGGGESGGGHTGGGESGGGHSGNPQGKTPAERAKQHREQTGRTMGGGEGKGGQTGGGGHTGGGSHSGVDEGTVTPTIGPQVPSDGAITGPIGGSTGGEHFVHPGTGGWGADTKVLRKP
jgi:hypothetical protein